MRIHYISYDGVLCSSKKEQIADTGYRIHESQKQYAVYVGEMRRLKGTCQFINNRIR